MAEEPDFIGIMFDWCASQERLLEKRGISIQLGRSPQDERSKPSAWVLTERSGRVANLLVWSSGEAEFEAGATNRVDVQEHRDVTTAPELVALLGRLVTFLDADDPAQGRSRSG